MQQEKPQKLGSIRTTNQSKIDTSTRKHVCTIIYKHVSLLFLANIQLPNAECRLCVYRRMVNGERIAQTKATNKK